MRSRVYIIGLLLAAVLPAQETALDLRSSLKIDLPKDSPVTLVSADLGESKASPRGGAMVLDLHSSLMLRNASGRRIRGITLLVLAQEVTPGGKGSVSVPSLDVAAGETFPVRVDLRLLRPLPAAASPLVRVVLDGVLFDDFSFYGENRLNSRRAMTVWETEARRDRRHLKSILEARGPEGLQQEMLASLARQADMPRLDVRIARGRATNVEGARQLQFTFLRLPDVPVELTGGGARITADGAEEPVVDVENRSSRAIRHLEIGWILRDASGLEFVAGSMPADVSLAPRAKGRVGDEVTLRFSPRGGGKIAIESMTAYLSNVEYADGSVWIPSRSALADPQLKRVAAPSPEEQRLSQFYRKKGLKALIEELNRF